MPLGVPRRCCINFDGWRGLSDLWGTLSDMRFLRRKPKPRPPGITFGDGKEMLLIDPFDRIAIHDGALFLRSSSGSATLHVPREGRAQLHGAMMRSLEFEHASVDDPA